MSEPITLYCTRWCPHCTRSRRILQRSGLAFREIDVDEVRGAEEEMRARNGGSGKVPTIIVGSRVMVEPSDTALSEALDAHGADT